MALITLITDRGRQIMASRVPGDPPLASIKIAVGDGGGTVYAPASQQTALVNERWRGTGAASLSGSKIGFSASIPANIGGFTIREIGVFVGPAGAEELLVVSQFGPQYKPAAGENGASTLTPVVGIDYTGSTVGAFTITLDQALQSLDPSVHRTVWGRGTVPPGNPVDGSIYAIGLNPTGDWAGRGGQIAKRRGTGWVFETPIDGHVIRESVSGVFWQKSGADYVLLSFPPDAHAHSWVQVTGKPTEFAPTAHNHPITDVTGLQGSLDGKVNKVGDTMTGSLAMPYGAGVTWGGTHSAWGPVAVTASGGDLYLQTGSTGTVRVTAAGDVYVGSSSSNNHTQIRQGGIEIANAAYAPYIDWKMLGADDYSWRTYANATNFEWMANDGGVTRYPFRLTKKGAVLLADTAQGSAGQVMVTQGDVALPAKWVNAGDIVTRLVYQWKLSVNTLVATLGGPWGQIPLNTLTKNNISGASASGGVITLPAGTYRGTVSVLQTFLASPANVGPMDQFRVQDTTNNATLYVASYAGAGQIVSFEFTLAGSANVQLQAYSGSTYNNYTVLALSPATPIATLTLEKIG